MKTISRYIMTLALLITAVGGAWADETLTETIITMGYSGSNLTVNGTYFKVSGTQFRSDGGYNGVRIANGKTATISLIDPNSSAKATKIVLYPDGGDTDVQYVKIDGAGTYSSTDVTVSKDVSITNDGSATISWGGNVNYGVSISKIEITYTAGPVVNINDAKTEASFTMPAFDATADYELVRDMSIQMTAQVGDGTDGVRYRVKKDDNNKFIPADMEMAAVPALFTVNDAIEQKALTQTQDYIVQIYAIDAEGQPTGDPMTFATFTFEPGIYAVKAVAAQGSDYDGETALSNTFKLFQGYEVTVPAGEFATFYKDEPLYADPVTSTDAKLYTIASVTDAKAVLSDAIETAPKNTPLLVYNAGEQDNTFLLIPADAEPNLAITVAPEFQGTLNGTTIAASTDAQTNYAFNGKAFVFVKNAIEVGPNKAWLSINTGVPSARITLVFDEATGVESVELRTENGEFATATWYDLNGRKLQGMPTKKGVYIMNGRKVVIR